jgi:VCBS repeat protein
MNLNVSYDASTLRSAPSAFFSAVNYVVNLFDSTFTANATINIEIGYGNFPYDNSVVPALGESIQNNLAHVGYSQAAQRLIAAGAPGSSTLPSAAPISGSLVVGSAQEKALGLIGPSSSLDGWVGIASNATVQQQTGGSWSFSPTATPGANQYYIVGTLEHEITEVMGRISYLDVSGEYGVMDLYRYAAPGVRQTGTGDASYFSTNGGVTNLDSWNNYNIANTDLGDWAPSAGPNGMFNYAGADAFNAYSNPGLINGLTASDLTLMQALGWGASSGSGGLEYPTFGYTLSYFGTNAGGWTSADQYPRVLADVNHDGMADIVGFASNGVQVSLAAGGGNFATPNLVLPNFGTNAGGWTSQDQYPRLVADTNGDGLGDVVGFASNGVQVSLGAGGGYFAAPTTMLSYFGTDAGGWTSQDQYPRTLGDVNGDGKSDIVGFASNGAQVSLATGGGNFSAPSLILPDFGTNAGGWTSQDQYPRLLADINGDGKADIVGFASDGVHVALATGGGNFSDLGLVLPDFGTNAGGWSSQDLYPRAVADVNGDGIADIVGFATDGVHVALATGGGHFAAASLEGANFGTNAGGWSSQTLYPRLVGDISGDHHADIVGFGSPGAAVGLFHT